MGKTLSRHLLKALETGKGEVVTYLPQDVTEKEARQFEMGGKLSLPSQESWRYCISDDGTVLRMVPTPTMDPYLVEEIRAFLVGQERRICIFEDALADSHDPCLARLNTKFITYLSEVYHVLFWHDADQERILQTVRRARSWLFIGAMTSLREGSCLDPSNMKLSEEELCALAEDAEGIIVGAYDGEGYLVWIKQ